MLRRYVQKLFGIEETTAYSTCQPCEAKYDYVVCRVEEQVVFDVLLTVHP